MKTEINIVKLLKPIKKDTPPGVDMRLDVSPTSLYYQIKDARSQARTIERKAQLGESDGDAKEEWNRVFTLAQKALSQNSKDLEIAAWLTESLLRKNGFYGLAQGFELIVGLVENFWDDLYPHPDEDGIETKIAPLVGLNGDEAEGSLILPIRQTAITQGSSVGPFALWQYQQALEISKISDPAAVEKSYASGAVRLDQIKKAVQESSPKFYKELYENLNAAVKNFKRLNDLLDEKCKQEAPPSSNINNTLQTFLDHIHFIVQDAPFSIATPEKTPDDSKQPEGNLIQTEEAPAATTIKPEEPIQPILNTQAIANREQALRLLIKISNYFKQAEPHSPLPYLLDRAVKWGNLPLPELLKEMIKDDNVRGTVFNLTGINLHKNESNHVRHTSTPTQEVETKPQAQQSSNNPEEPIYT